MKTMIFINKQGYRPYFYLCFDVLCLFIFKELIKGTCNMATKNTNLNYIHIIIDNNYIISNIIVNIINTISNIICRESILSTLYLFLN